MGKILATSIVLMLSACQPEAGTGDVAGKTRSPLRGSECRAAGGAARTIDIEALTSSSSSLEGALVRVSGYYALDFEHSAIYAIPKSDPFDHHFESGIWLDRMDPTLSGKNVQVTGIFTRNFKGHLGQWPGSICVISAAEISPDAP
jgi:hypothetical protein